MTPEASRGVFASFFKNLFQKYFFFSDKDVEIQPEPVYGHVRAMLKVGTVQRSS